MNNDTTDARLAKIEDGINDIKKSIVNLTATVDELKRGLSTMGMSSNGAAGVGAAAGTAAPPLPLPRSASPVMTSTTAPQVGSVRAQSSRFARQI